MAKLDFPSSPSIGQVYPVTSVPGLPSYRWDGEKWGSNNSLATAVFSDTPPASPTSGMFWWESDTGQLYVYYDDGNTKQWVSAVPIPDASVYALKAQIDQALAANGVQINGGMDVSQESGAASVPGILNIRKYVVDGWYVDTTGVQNLTAAQVTNIVPDGFANSMQVGVAVANASPAPSDFTMIAERIEGYRIARLGWGTAAASPITLAFWVRATRTGNYSTAIINGASNRSYAATFTVSTTNTWEYKTITIPGDTAGTWTKDNSLGMTVCFTMMAGSGRVGTANTWTAATLLGVTGTINGVAASSDGMWITGVVVLPGTHTITAAQSPLLMRSYDAELLTCKRYFYNGAPAMRGIVNGANADRIGCRHPVTMRAAPTTLITVVLPFFNGNTATTVTGIITNYSTTTDLEITGPIGVSLPLGIGVVYQNGTGNINVDARL